MLPQATKELATSHGPSTTLHFMACSSGQIKSTRHLLGHRTRRL